MTAIQNGRLVAHDWVSFENHPNCLGLAGWDKKARVHFSTLCMGGRGTQVVLIRKGAPVFDAVYPTKSDMAALELAIQDWKRSS